MSYNHFPSRVNERGYPRRKETPPKKFWNALCHAPHLSFGCRWYRAAVPETLTMVEGKGPWDLINFPKAGDACMKADRLAEMIDPKRKSSPMCVGGENGRKAPAHTHKVAKKRKEKNQGRNNPPGLNCNSKWGCEMKWKERETKAPRKSRKIFLDK